MQSANQMCVRLVCSCSRFIVNSLAAARLAGTIMMVVSTGWLLGNNYLTVLCLHWNTQCAPCVCVLVCVYCTTEKYSKMLQSHIWDERPVAITKVFPLHLL